MTRTRRRWFVAAALLVATLVLALLTRQGYRAALAEPVVVERTLTLPGLPAGATLRVLLISDTHEGWPDMPPARLQRIAAQAQAQRPDLILLLGDYKGGKPLERSDWLLEDALRPFARLQAPLGVWAVMGNHDEPYWTPRVFAALDRERRGAKLLVNRAVDLGPLVLGGADSRYHGTDARGTFAGMPAGKPRLLMAHEPDRLGRLPAAGLIVAGHTHGGQMFGPGWRWAPELLLGPQACWRGYCEVEGRRLFVTSGVGTSTLPLRVVPPEMVALTLTP